MLVRVTKKSNRSRNVLAHNERAMISELMSYRVGTRQECFFDFNFQKYGNKTIMENQQENSRQFIHKLKVFWKNVSTLMLICVVSTEKTQIKLFCSLMKTWIHGFSCFWTLLELLETYFSMHHFDYPYSDISYFLGKSEGMHQMAIYSLLYGGVFALWSTVCWITQIRPLFTIF